MRTRNWLWHEPRSLKAATKIAKGVLKWNDEVRKARRSCPVGPCGFKYLLVNKKGGNIWCPKCGLMAPNSIYSVKTGRKVRF
jgi:hypothetical protein